MRARAAVPAVPRIGSRWALSVLTVVLACAPVEPLPDGGTDGTDGGGAVTLSLSRSASRVVAGEALQLTATVAGTGDLGVTWSVNGTAGGDATVGTIDGTGRYLAPAVVPSPATVTVRAASAADPSAFAEATLTVVAPALSGLLARYSTGAVRLEAPIAHGANDACTATGSHEYQGACRPASDAPVDWVSAGSFDVEWTGSLNVPAAGEYRFASDGVVRGKVKVVVNEQVLADLDAADATWEGTATLPAGRVPVTLTFTSTFSPNRVRFAWRGLDGVVAPVPRAHLEPRVAVALDATPVTVGAAGTHAFTAEVLGSLDASVTWSLEPGTCGSEAGSITAAGVYTAGSPSTTCTVTVVATSAADATVTGRVVVTVTGVPPPAPVELATTTVGFDDLQLATDGAGNALAAWVDYAAPGSLWGARFDATTKTWGPRFAIHKDPGNLGARELAMAGNATGQVVLVFSQRHELTPGNQVTDLWARRYELSTGTLGTPAVLDGSEDTFGMPAVALHATGAAVAAWYREPAYGPRQMYGGALPAGSNTWGHLQRLDAVDADVGWAGSSPSFTEWSGVTMDAAGNGTVVWRHHTNDVHVLTAARFHAASGAWEAERTVTPPTSTAPNIETVLSLGATTMALWYAGQPTASTWRIAYAIADATTGVWGTPQVAVDSPQTIEFGSVRAVASGAGHVLVAWQQTPTPGAQAQLWASTRAPGGTWSPPSRLDAEAAGAGTPALAMNASGVGVVVWNQAPPGTQNRVPRAARVDAATGAWSSARLVAEGLTGAAHDGQCAAVDTSGLGRLLWVQFPKLLAAQVP